MNMRTYEKALEILAKMEECAERLSLALDEMDAEDAASNQFELAA